MPKPGDWKPLWERREMVDREKHTGGTRRVLVTLVVFLLCALVLFGLIRSILSLFRSRAAMAPLSLSVCATRSVGADLMRNLAKAYLVRAGARDEKLEDVGTPQERAVAHLPGTFSQTEINLSLQDSSSMTFEALAGDSCQVAIVNRELDPIEASRFHEPPAANLFGLDGVVVVVHPRNPVRAVNIDDLRFIFAGETTDWSDLGGSTRRLTVVLPPLHADETSTFIDRVLDGRLPSDQLAHAADVAQTVASPGEEGAIGITTFHAADPAKIVHIIDSAGREFAPSTLTIGQRRYPLTTPVLAYAYDGDAAKSFVAFLLSYEAQSVVVNDGFVSPFSF